MTSTPKTTSIKKRLFLFGSLVTLGAWQWQANQSVVFADRSPRHPVIPASLRNIPVESEPPAQPAISPNSTVRFSLGDRLKINLFERVDLSDDEQINIPTTGLVERTELTGEYIVQQNGYIVLPLLGAIEIEGRSTEQVVRALQAAFIQSMRRGAKASVMLVDREPVYVVGRGIKPGAFKFSPGMTVLHAVALTGTGNDQNSDLYAHTEYARGLERLEIATHRLKKQLAQAAALRAQQSEQSPEIPAGLVELVGAQEARKLVDSAVGVRKLIVAAMQPQIAAYQAALAAARQEAASHTTRIALLEEHVKIDVQRRDMLVNIRKQNDGLGYPLLQMENEVASIKEKTQEAVASLSKAQDNIAQAEQNLAKLEANTKLELQNEIIATDNDIAEQEATLKAARRLTSDLRIASLRMASTGQDLSYEIIRRGRSGSSRLKADQTAELVPGDLIKVISTGDNSGF
jgi:exopolysaccharide production protein ExoF